MRTITRASVLPIAGWLLAACGSGGGTNDVVTLSPGTYWVDKEVSAGRWSSLQADSRGRPHLAYYDSASRTLKYAVLDAASRFRSSVVDSAGDVGKYASLVVDAGDHAHIAYYDATNDQLKVARDAGGRWHLAAAFSDGGGFAGSLAVDKDETAHLAFLTARSFDLMYATHAPWDKSQAGVVPLDMGVMKRVTDAIDTQVAIGLQPKSQTAVVAYNHHSSGSLMVMRLDAGHGWVSDVVDSGGPFASPTTQFAGQNPALFVAGENDFHVSYYHRERRQLKYAHFDGKRWASEVVDDTGALDELSSLVVACPQPSVCKPYVAYFDRTSHVLKVAGKSAAGSWVAEHVGNNATGAFARIERLQANRLAVSYVDDAANGLKLAVFEAF